jgi:hypothetical protein
MTLYSVRLRHAGVGTSNPVEIRSYTTEKQISDDNVIFSVFIVKIAKVRIYKTCPCTRNRPYATTLSVAIYILKII